MTSLSDVIDQIISTLKDRPSGISPEVLAEQYHVACESVNARLSRIEVMLGNNSEIEALQVAEEPPRLMGLVELLSFGDEVAWQEYCETHSHAVAPLIDFRQVDALAALYKKGLSPNHPLYRDYRAAIRSRDDDKALELLGIISRLNPSDANAVKEMHRLGRKGTIAELAQLKSGLQSGTDGELIARMAKIEAIAPDEEYRARPEWKSALVKRGAYQRKEGRKRIGELLEIAEANLGAESWRSAAGHEAEISRLAGEYGFPNEDGFSERLKAVTNTLTGFREDAAREVSIRKIVRKLESLAEQVETRGVTPAGITVDYATSTLDAIRRQERELGGLSGSVPDSSRARIRTTSDRLEQIVHRARSRKKMRNALVGALTAILLLAGAGFGFVALQASSYKDELDDAITSGSVQQAKSLIGSTDRSSLMFKFPSVVAKVAEAEQWAANRTDEASSAEKLLSDLEDGARSGFADRDDAVSLHSKLEICGKLVSEVAEDLRPSLASRYAVVRNEGEGRLLALQEGSAKRVTEITERCRDFAERVDYRGYAEEAGKPLEGLRAEIRNLEPLLKQEDPLLKLPVNVASELRSAGSQIEDIEGKFKAVDEAYRGLSAADDLDSFREKLESLAQTRFADAGRAREIGAAIPSGDKMKANLLTGGDLSDYKLAVTMAANGKWLSRVAGDRDREWVKELRSHPCFSEVYHIKYKEINGFCRGEPLWETNESDNSRTVELDFSEIPKRRSELPSYSKKTQRVTNPGDFSAELSKPALLMTELNLYGFLDNTGTSFNRSAVKLVDVIFKAKLCPPLARAFLLGEVFRLMSGAESEWGTFLSPALQKDIEDYKALKEKESVMPSGWMVEDRAASAKVWEEYFATREPGSRSSVIVSNGRMIASVERAKIVLGGHVNRDGEIVWQGEYAKGLVLGFSTDEQGEEVRLCIAGVMDGKDFDPVLELARSSPLILIESRDDGVEFLLSKNPIGHKFD
jgi:hypothetical protein